MKAVKIISASVLIVSFFMVGLCYAQSMAEQSYTKGVEHGSQGKFKEAKEEFENVLKFDPFFEPAKRCLTIIVDVTDQKIKNETAIHIFKGSIHSNKGQFDQAISDFTKAIELNPKYTAAYLNRGNAYYNKGQYDQAISDFTKAIELNPKYAKAYNNRGVAFYFKREYGKAWDDVQKAKILGYQVNPGFLNALQEASEYMESSLKKGIIEQKDTRMMKISVILVESESQAKDLIQKLDSGANFADLAKQYSTGPYKEKGGDFGYIPPGYLAKKLDTVALKLRIGEYGGIIETNFGYYILMKTDEKSPASEKIPEINKTVEAKPNKPQFYYNQGVSNSKLGNYKEAIEAYDQAISLDSKYINAYYMRAYAYWKLELYQKAIEDYGHVIALFPNNYQAYYNRGLAYYHTGWEEEACKDFKKACELGDCKGLKWAKKKGFCQ